MELRQYISLFRKWAWLILLTTAIAASSSYFYSRTMDPIYRAETTLMVGRLIEDTNVMAGSQQASTNLAQAYALLVVQPPILQATAEAVQWPGEWQTLFFKVAATIPPGSTQLLKVTASSTDPEQAKAIADELARQLILQGPVSAQQKQGEEQRTFVTSQLTQIKLQIETAQRTLGSMTNQATLETDPIRLNDLNTRTTALQTKITDWQKNYASLSTLISQSSLFVNVLAPALLPTAPISPNIPQNVFFAALAGLVLAGGAILLLEYLDDTIKVPEEAQRILNLSTLGAITRITGIAEPSDHLITVKHPRSPIAEAYRVLRTNLRFSGIENPSGVLLVTSSGPSEGKTTTAANLGVILAQAGRRVILLDTDLRRPALHKLFGLSNDLGLSSLFLGDAPTLESVVQSTEIEGLRVITSGPLPPNPAEVLDSKYMTEILESLRSQSDLLILDSPPTLAVADASILGSRCSGAILVVDAGRTRSEACRRGLATLQQTGAKVFGVVLNKMSTHRASGNYSYYYYADQDGKAGRKRVQPRTN